MPKRIITTVFALALFFTGVLDVSAAATPASRVLLVKTKTSSAVYAIVNNQRVPITSPSELANKGYRWKNLKIITDKKMSAIPLAQANTDEPLNAAVAPSVSTPVPAKQAVTPDHGTKVAAIDPNVSVFSMTANNNTPLTNTKKEFSVLPIITSGYASDLNNDGTVLGVDFDGDQNGAPRNYIWNNGQKNYNVNKPKELVGAMRFSCPENIDGGCPHAFVMENGVRKDLGPGEAVAINDSGEVVYNSNGHLWIYKKNNKTDLGNFGAKSAYAVAINNNGQILGTLDSATGADGQYPPPTFVWTNGTLDRFFAVAKDINNLGEVAGYIYFDAEHSEFAHGDTHAIVRKNGVIVDLNKFLPSDSSIVLTEALKINDNEQVLAAGHDGPHGLNETSYFLVNLPADISL